MKRSLFGFSVRSVAFSATMFLLSSWLFAAGQTEEDDFQQVEGTGNWEHTIDVSELEPGLYNILVRARDEAGNETIGGPYNIFVDPESDLPELSISYPQRLQRTDEDLFVVGSAWDDDAVSHVEVRVNDGSFRRAEGDRFWSLLVPLAALDDGQHTVTARAVDVNGVTGTEYTVPFRLDRSGPRSEVSSHESGVLVTGRTNIEGTVEDENGVVRLSLIRGDGKEQLNLRGRENEPRQFSFQIDPRNMEEGPSVWWLESVDGTGAVGTAPFLFFVDTSAPELEILYPQADDRVDAQLRVVGRVRDTVGTESLSYELSTGEAGEIPLRPGDPFWTLAVDLPVDTNGNVTLTLRAVDLAGNTDEQRIRLSIDRAGDAPVVRLLTPAEDALQSEPALAGFVVDDDGPAQIVYSLNSGAPVTLDASTAFSLPLNDAVSGANEIEIYAIDRYGLVGPTVRRRFDLATPLAGIALETVARSESSEEYAPGFVAQANERITLVGSVRSASGRHPDRVSYAIGTDVSSAAVEEDGSFEVQLPRSSDAGALRIDLWFTNELGATSRTAGYYVQLPAGDDETPVPDPDDLIETGIHLAPGGVPSGDGVPSLSDVPLAVTSATPLLLGISGGRISDVALEPAVEFLNVRASAGRVEITAAGSGFAPSVRVTGTVGGRAVRSEPLTIRTEFDAPVVDVAGVAAGDYLSESPRVVVSASDASGLSTVRAGVAPFDSQQTVALSPITGEATTYAFTPSLPREDGPAVITVEAVDAAGATRILEIPVVIDRSPLAATVVAPAAGETVNGTVSVVAIVEDYATLAGVVAYDPESPSEDAVESDESTDGSADEAGQTPDESSAAGVAATPVPADRMVVHQFAVSVNDPLVQFALTDRAGNESTVESSLRTDDREDQPRLTVQIPAENGVVVDDFRLSGVLLDDDEPVALEYSINGEEAVRVDASGPFDIRLDMTDLEDGVHAIEVIGYDLEGVASEPVTRSFVVSRTAPTVALEAPTIESFQRGVVQLAGSAQDPNAIERVEVSVDGGASFQRARGGERWTYPLDTSLMDDGTHSVLIRAFDTADMSSLLTTTINVDNTEPLLELALPSDGETVGDRFLIDGRAEDAAFDQIRLVLQPLDDAAEPIELAQFTAPGPFAYNVNTESLRVGWYNLRVEATDRAGNARQISQNLRVEPVDQVEVPQIVLPMDGATLAGDVRVVVRAPADLGTVPLFVNDRRVATVELDREGRGATVLTADSLTEGELALSLQAATEPDQPDTVATVEPSATADDETDPSGTSDAAGQPVDSEDDASSRSVHMVTYSREGPWLSISGPTFDAYVRDRPFLTGTAGYVYTAPPGDEADARRLQALAREYAVSRVEVSSDNGQTWVDARGTEEWRHRIETTELPDGPIHYVVRALFANGESAVSRHTVVVDEQPPVVRLLAPSERDTFDESIRVVGASADENALADVSVVLRSGDKASYELPSFIQGLYLDVHALGATYFDIGAGLSFFDDNVRLQAQIGVSPPGRFSGLVLGTKLLANIASVPASAFFGPDYEWLGAALALGANFSYFTMSDDSIAFTDEGLVLAGMVAQLEFPIVRVEDLALFNTYSLYTEYQLWFISSDVQAGVSGRLSLGLRLNVF